MDESFLMFNIGMILLQWQTKECSICVKKRLEFSIRIYMLLLYRDQSPLILKVWRRSLRYTYAQFDGKPKFEVDPRYPTMLGISYNSARLRLQISILLHPEVKIWKPSNSNPKGSVTSPDLIKDQLNLDFTY